MKSGNYRDTMHNRIVPEHVVAIGALLSEHGALSRLELRDFLEALGYPLHERRLISLMQWINKHPDVAEISLTKVRRDGIWYYGIGVAEVSEERPRPSPSDKSWMGSWAARAMGYHPRQYAGA